MSINELPVEILSDILARLPVKSLVPSTCVCQSWNALIRSPGFVHYHVGRNVARNSGDYLLVHTSQQTGFTIYHAQTFVKCFDVNHPRIKSVTICSYGSCNGVVCISAFGRVNVRRPIYLCNPSIRKIKELPDAPEEVKNELFAALGFGFHGGQNDCRYKVVRIVRIRRKKKFFRVDVYRLETDTWTKIPAVPPVSEDARFLERSAFLNGVLYWITRGPSQHCNAIVSFDLATEVFQRIMLPVGVGLSAVPIRPSTTIRVFENSLSLFHKRRNGNADYCDIWVLEMDTWRIDSTLRLPHKGDIPWPLSLRIKTNGNVYMLVEYGLVLYDPASNQRMDTGVTSYHQYVDAYTESLVLLD